ncbi:GAF and ANTAR domain-containing protein [Mycobacterium sp. CVI_P3]|uniref:GAF and ANTAR domain-containing protein n=1 Tax=Mycobacterium pinniadriaticum TaxID=2994102 RepID=A0ABT3SK93_9MYCO|nr:GAF and ANTAR domain-containing protein [Mycobacterium pinniadriaticum]MCX2933550.1 GAF and ANTAR domain-containing protein [Mycobacterium pinniadriaticum]MCX2939949.1 GAF and ANTAR domain-containing protein [Mycobacterium pinniadriaticum]
MDDYDAQPGRKPPPEPELSPAQLQADELDLHAGLSGLSGIVADACSVDEMLGQVAQFAVQAIPGADGAGVTLVEPHTDSGSAELRIQARSVTAEFVGIIDTLQYEKLGEGPCITCIRSGRPAVSGSLGSDRRWPHFGGSVARMGVHSALALPLTIGHRVIGAINAYAPGRDAFAEHAVQLGSQFAGPTAVSVYNAQLLASTRLRTKQLQQALRSRAVIDQAIGIVRSRSGGTAQEAFDRLTRISQREHVKLADVAEQLVDEAVRRARARQQ